MARNVAITCFLLLGATVALFRLGTGETRADFTYVNPSGIHTLDPARMSWTQDLRVALNLWEGLTSSDPKTTEPMAGAALFPPDISNDGRTYTFSIREDSIWSNSDPVTAVDFIRGWRRGMEPGTATDYQFMFTDHIVGAQEYVQWRHNGVTLLTILSHLKNGEDIDEKQATDLGKLPEFHRLAKLWMPEGAAGSIENNDVPNPAELIQKIRKAKVDWEQVHQSFFQRHVEQLDARFSEVGFEAIDHNTLRVTLTQPCPYFLDLTAFPTWLPCHKSIERLREQYAKSPLTEQGLVVFDPQWTKPGYHRNDYPGLITNGAYSLIEWKFKQRARLRVNPYYRAASEIPCKTIDMLVIDNISASIMAYEAGYVDFLPSLAVPYDHEIARLAATGLRNDFKSCHTLATYFLQFNCASERILGKPNPFLDRRVRKAFAMAVNKQAIVENVLQRGDRIAHSFVPAGLIKGYESPAGLRFDPIRARTLLAEAGYADARDLGVVEMLYVPSDDKIIQAIAHMWEKNLGVQVNLRCEESKSFAEDKANHRFMIARANWYADYYDPTTFLDCLVTGNGNNDAGYHNLTYDLRVAEAALAKEQVERMALLSQAESILVEEDLPIIPILHYAELIAIKPYIDGLQPNPRLRFSFQYVSVQK